MNSCYNSPQKIITSQNFNPLTWEEVRKIIKAIDVVQTVKEARSAPFLFPTRSEIKIFPTRPASKISFPTESDVPSTLWFIGDIHGDLLTLVNAWHFISTESLKRASLPAVVFLGDFIDRGPYSHEVLIFLSWLISKNPGRIQIIAGNHDVALKKNFETNKFYSEVAPAEYSHFLNEESCDHRDLIADFGIDCFQRAPAAIFFPDGLIATHGGVPHRDLLQDISTIQNLDNPRCIQDFVWLRFNERSPRKIPNRANKGCEFGIQDFNAFRSHMETLGMTATRMVRGHDHFPERYSIFDEQGIDRVLTLNSMGYWLEDEISEDKPPTAFVGLNQTGQLPKLHPIEIPTSYVADAFPGRQALQ